MRLGCIMHTAQALVRPPMHALRLCREILEQVSGPTQAHPDSLRLQQSTFMGGFLLARVGEPRTMTAVKETASLVQLSNFAAAISTVRAYRTDKPWPIPAKAA